MEYKVIFEDAYRKKHEVIVIADSKYEVEQFILTRFLIIEGAKIKISFSKPLLNPLDANYIVNGGKCIWPIKIL